MRNVLTSSPISTGEQGYGHEETWEQLIEKHLLGASAPMHAHLHSGCPRVQASPLAASADALRAIMVLPALRCRCWYAAARDGYALHEASPALRGARLRQPSACSVFAELLDLAIERRLANTELLGRLRAIAADGPKYRLDVLALHLRKRTDVARDNGVSDGEADFCR